MGQNNSSQIQTRTSAAAFEEDSADPTATAKSSLLSIGRKARQKKLVSKISNKASGHPTSQQSPSNQPFSKYYFN
jgi:hypothetical protein